MINLDFKNLQELRGMEKDNESLINKVKVLDNFNFALNLVEVLRGLEVEKFKVNLIKEEYNDEGFKKGVYCSILDHSVNNSPATICETDGYDLVYNRKYRAEMLNPKIATINSFLWDNFEVLKNTSLINSLEGRTFNTVTDMDFDNIVKFLVGEDFFTEWKIMTDKKSLDETILVNKNTNKNTKI